MSYAKVVIETDKASLIYKSLKPDIKSDVHHKMKLKLKDNRIIFSVKTNKLNHMKSIIYSFISLVNMLEGIE